MFFSTPERTPEGPRVDRKLKCNITSLSYLQLQTDLTHLDVKLIPDTSIGQTLKVKTGEGKQKPHSISQYYAGTAMETLRWLMFEQRLPKQLQFSEFWAGSWSLQTPLSHQLCLGVTSYGRHGASMPSARKRGGRK